MKFVIEKKEGSIQFANTEEKERGGKESYYPNKTSTVSNGEIGKFLFIDNEKDIVDVRFLDGNGNRLWKILEYGQPAKVYIQTRNMAGTKIKRQIFLNKAKGDDIEIDKEKEYTVPDNELLEIDINTNFFKKYVPEKERKTVSMFYYVLKESDGDVFKYPKDLQISQKLDISKPNFYHHLKLMESPQLMNALAATNAPLIVGEPLEPASTSTGTCVCKDYDLIWGNKVSCEFRKKVVEIAKELWPNDYLNMANNLMAVFAWESGETFKAGVPNQANSGGTGLIQFMPETAAILLNKEITIEYTSDFWGKRLKRVKEFAEMSEIKQLDYVKRYFEPLKNKKVEFVDFYLQVLFPASSLKEDHIVFANSLDKITTRLNESEKLRNLRVRAYSQNSGLDSNSDGKVWKSEIQTKVQKYVTDGESQKATSFDCSSSSLNTHSNAEENEFGLVQVTKLGNPHIINYGVEDNYSYRKKDGTMSARGTHGDDWMKPEKANAFSQAVNDLVKEYPKQKIHLNDCSAFNPAYNLGHSANGGHSRGDAFDCKFLTVNGNGTNNIHNLTDADIAINARFIEILKATGHFSKFYSDGGKIPGSSHASGHADHLHGD